VSGRNVFENNDAVPDEEDLKAVGNGPHIMLPPLTEGHEYVLTDLPSGRRAVIVVEDHIQACNCTGDEKCALCPKPLPERDEFGRKYTR
jgi:hypothetical protein